MANYSSPFASYTPDSGSALQGFAIGLNVRRNIEETAKLVREREMQEQAQQLIKGAQAKQKETADAATFKRTYAEKLRLQREVGQPISDEDLDLAVVEASMASVNHVERMRDVSEELFFSGNPLASEWSQKNLESATAAATALEGLRHKASDVGSDKRHEQGADRRLGMQLDSNEMLGLKEMALRQQEGERNRVASMHELLAKVEADERMQGRQLNVQQRMQDKDIGAAMDRLKVERDSAEREGDKSRATDLNKVILSLSTNERISDKDRDGAMSRLKTEIQGARDRQDDEQASVLTNLLIELAHREQEGARDRGAKMTELVTKLGVDMSESDKDRSFQGGEREKDRGLTREVESYRGAQATRELNQKAQESLRNLDQRRKEMEQSERLQMEDIHGQERRQGRMIEHEARQGDKNRQADRHKTNVQAGLEMSRLSSMNRKDRVDVMRIAVDAVKEGAPLEVVNESLSGFDISFPDLRAELGNVSEEVAAELSDIDKRIANEEKDIERGRGDPEMLELLQKRRSKLRHEDRNTYKLNLKLEEVEEERSKESAGWSVGRGVGKVYKGLDSMMGVDAAIGLGKGAVNAVRGAAGAVLGSDDEEAPESDY